MKPPVNKVEVAYVHTPDYKVIEIQLDGQMVCLTYDRPVDAGALHTHTFNILRILKIPYRTTTIQCEWDYENQEWLGDTAQ